MHVNAPAIEVMRRLHSGSVRCHTAQDVREFAMDLTGDEKQAEASVYAWREQRQASGQAID